MSPLAAFQVSRPWHPHMGAELVFAASAEGAIEKLGHQQHFDEGEPFTVERVPEFDKYAPGPVPTSVLLESGWSVNADELGADVVSYLRQWERETGRRKP